MLFIDIETSPNLAYVWRLFNQNVSLSQLVEPTEMISFAAKWRGNRKVHFFSDFHNDHATMVKAAFDMLDEADVVVHYNGRTFDVPHMNREFLLNGPGVPPSPFQQIDLLQTVRKRFRMASNKLDHITQQLGQAGKVRHTGFDLWRDCMAGDPKAWGLMRRYNRGDVTELEELYDNLLPWIMHHPNMSMYSPAVHLDPDTGKPMEVHVCERCPNGGHLIRKGYAYTKASKFQRFRCKQCGAWSRGKKAIARVNARGIL
jgi:DNA polymerase elongation subunit (family B)